MVRKYQEAQVQLLLNNLNFKEFNELCHCGWSVLNADLLVVIK